MVLCIYVSVYYHDVCKQTQRACHFPVPVPPHRALLVRHGKKITIGPSPTRMHAYGLLYVMTLTELRCWLA